MLIKSTQCNARVLIVDGLAINRTIFKAVLSAHDYDVDVADNALAARVAAMASRYDLILMNVDLRDQAGWAPLSSIRAAGSASADARIVALSVSATSDMREQLERAGIDDIIVRPVQPNDLIRRVKDLLHAAQPTARRKPEVVIWNRDSYDVLARRLGEDRLRKHLDALGHKIEAFAHALSTGPVADNLIQHQVHDIRSVAGMLGFEEMLAVCTTSQELAIAGSTRCERDNLIRASRRALEAIRSADTLAHVARVAHQAAFPCETRAAA